MSMFSHPFERLLEADIIRNKGASRLYFESIRDDKLAIALQKIFETSYHRVEILFADMETLHHLRVIKAARDFLATRPEARLTLLSEVIEEDHPFLCGLALRGFADRVLLGRLPPHCAGIAS